MKNQFGFRNKHSTNHALIDITKKTRDTKRPFACGIFIDLQKHLILKHLKNSYQFTNIKGSYSERQKITHGVPQGSALGPLLFPLYINDFNKSIIHSSIPHFANNANLLLVGKSLKKTKKFVNHDLKHHSHKKRKDSQETRAEPAVFSL